MKNCEHLIGKTAIITGAAGGIGAALTHELKACGMNLVLVGRNSEKLDQLLAEVGQTNARAVKCVGDLSDIAFAERILETARRAFGSIDVLINNAGLSHNCPLTEMTPELFDEIMRVNVRAPYFLCQKAIPDLKNSDCATIINICSVVAHKGYPNQSVYVASKHALLGVSKTMANELFRDNIRVHVISPGGVFTPMISVVRPELSPEGMILPEDVARIARFYLECRKTNAVIDEIELHRVTKEPFA